VIKSHEDELQVTGTATWQSSVPSVQPGYYETQTGELDDSGKPKGQVLAIGYDPDRSAFPPTEDGARCAAKLELYGRYLKVTDNFSCGGMHVTFTGVYVRVTPKSPIRLSGLLEHKCSGSTRLGQLQFLSKHRGARRAA
jgi:hypothetical protein